MTGTGLKVRYRGTGEISDAICLDEPFQIQDVERDAAVEITAEKGAILIFDAERHPDWPESRIVADVYQPDEMDAFQVGYEIVSGDR